MMLTGRPAGDLNRRWRQQILSHCNPRLAAARKGFVALSFVDHANSSSMLVDINSLSVVLVFDDETHKYDRAPLRLCCYDVSRVPHGVQWGGADNCQLFKNLALAPKYGARGQRLDRSKHELLALALRLNGHVSRAARHPAAPWPSLRLPRLWAGFRARQANGLRGEGPEFARARRQLSATPIELFRDAARQIDGLVAYPLDWVSGQIESAVAVFAELTLGVRRQVCRIGDLPQGLIGFQGASAFDFYNSRFRISPGKRRSSRSDACTRVAILKSEAVRSRTLQSESVVA